MGEYNGQQPTTTKQQPIQHGLLQKPAQKSNDDDGRCDDDDNAGDD